MRRISLTRASRATVMLAAAGGVLAVAMATVPPAAASPASPVAPPGSAASGARLAAADQRVGAAPVLPAGARALGTPSAATPLRLDIALRPTHAAGLQAFATDVSTPGTPDYRHYLTAAQFTARYAPSLAVIGQLDTVLREAGLPPGRVSANHLVIPVATTVGRAAVALDTGFETYRLASGRVVIANTRAPLLPTAVARAAQAVIGLNTVLTLTPSLSAAQAARRQAARRQAGPARAAAGPKPCSAAVSAAGKTGGWTYDQLARAYSISGLYAKGALGNRSSAAIFELGPFAARDIAAFQACYHTSTSVSTVAVDGGATGSASVEATLDIETVIGIAPATSILVYEAPNSATSMLDEYTKIVDDDRAGVLSSSWGECESATKAADAGLIASENTVFQQAAIEGMSVLVASGDTGSEACYQSSTSMRQLAVQDPASQPFVTSVGGTDLTALGPAPHENVWNEASKQKGAGGGGISTMWKKPAWQAGAGVVSSDSSARPCGATSGYCREVPDVSASADPLHGDIIRFGGGWIEEAGTSAAAPLWAAMLADINSQTSPATRAGFLNPRLYTMPTGTFNDIVSGNNAYTGKHGHLYTATGRYDMASGLGTPIATKLAPALGRWAALEAPLPSDDRPRKNYDQRIWAVTCPASCEAIGIYQGGTGNGGPAVALTGSSLSWSPHELPDTMLSGEACPTPTSCVLVGWGGYGDLFTGWGSTWQGQQVPLPPGAATGDGPASLTSAACVSAARCVLTGYYPDNSGHQQGILVTGHGTAWSSVKAPLPANAAANPFVVMEAIACPSASSCTAVGYYTDSAGRQEGLLVAGAGKTWTATEMPFPARSHPAANPDVIPWAVTCPSVSSCTAIGSYNSSSGSQGLLLTGSGKTWTATRPPLPANAAPGAEVSLNGVACPTATSCLVTGTYSASVGADQGMLLTGHGTSWTSREAPLPAHGLGVLSLGPATCVSASACLVVGTYSDTTEHSLGLLLTGAGKSWTAAKAPEPANSSGSISNYINLDTAACHSAAACVAAGSYIDKSGFIEPLIVSGAIR